MEAHSSYPLTSPSFLRYPKEVLGLKAKAGLLFFVCAGVFVGLVVFGNTVARDKIHSTAEKEDSIEAARKPDSLQNAIGDPVPITAEAPAETTAIATPQANTSGSTNLTANLASLIGKNIVDKNPEGPVGDNLTVMGADGMAEAAIAESMKSFNTAYFFPEITEAELTVDNAQSTTAYRAAAASITGKTESEPPPPVDDPVASQMKIFAKRYEAEVASLRALAVPPALIAEHTQAIRRAVGKQRIFEVVADYENEPIYAMLALKLWDTIK